MEGEKQVSRYGINKYVADGEVQVWDCPELHLRATVKFGKAKYDPAWLFDGHAIWPDQIGKPQEMVLRIAGVTYYPTPKGYVQI